MFKVYQDDYPIQSVSSSSQIQYSLRQLMDLGQTFIKDKIFMINYSNNKLQYLQIIISEIEIQE